MYYVAKGAVASLVILSS